MANPSKDLQTIYKEYVERELAGLDAAFQEKFGAQRQGEGGQRLQRALGRTTALDIETGGIDPRLSVYESSLAHYGAPIRGELFRLSQSDRDDLTPFAQKLLRERGRALGIPDLAGRLTSDTTLPSSEKWASSVFEGISGRDLIIQNLKFESGFLGARFGEEEFQSWLKGARLETKSAGSVPQSKLFETDEKVLRLLSDAQHETGAPTREAFEETTKKWGRVFTEGYYSSFFGEGSRPAEGVTRVYDQLNITRSVLGLAQAKGAMDASFDVHTGTSIDLFSQYAYGQKEFHAAPLDVKMQQHSLETFLDIGRRLTEGKDLTESQKGLLQYIGERQPELKRENARKRLLTAFFGFEEQREKLKPGSLEGQLETFRDVAPSSYNRPYERYNPSTDSWEAAGEIRGRSQRGKEVALKDMDAVVRKLQHGASSRGGAHVDYREEWERLKGGVIARYEEQKKLNLGRVGPNIGFSDIKTRETTRGDLFATREEAILSAAASEGVVKARAEAMAGPAAPDGPGRFGRNWKTAGALGLGAIVVGSLFSGSDDEYNYIEGLRHEGMAGSSRRYTTEFGSGYQGPNPWLHPSYNEAQDEPRFSVGRASSMGATYQEHFKKFTEPREENELLSAYGSAGTALHRIEAARKFEAGEIERAEEFVHDPWHGITGHIDLTLAGGVPADVKTVTERGLEQIRRRGAREKHLSQLNFYMYMKGSERGYLEYVSRENPENREIVWAGFDPDLLKRDLARQQAARKTVRRSVRIGLRDEDELPRAAGIERLRAAAVDEEGETARDTRFWNFWRLQVAFKEEMAYLEEVKARRRARNAPPQENRIGGRDDDYNTIEAFRHDGYAGLNRRIFGFGSGLLKEFGERFKGLVEHMGEGVYGLDTLAYDIVSGHRSSKAAEADTKLGWAWETRSVRKRLRSQQVYAGKHGLAGVISNLRGAVREQERLGRDRIGFVRLNRHGRQRELETQAHEGLHVNIPNYIIGALEDISEAEVRRGNIPKKHWAYDYDHRFALEEAIAHFRGGSPIAARDRTLSGLLERHKPLVDQVLQATDANISAYRTGSERISINNRFAEFDELALSDDNYFSILDQSDFWLDYQWRDQRFWTPPQLGNAIEGMPREGMAGAYRGPNTQGTFESPWTGKIIDAFKLFGEETKSFAKQFPRTSMMMGAGAVLGAFSHFGGGREREEPGDGFFTGLLNTAVVGASVIGALAVAPGLIGAAGYSMVAARATKSAGTKSGKGFGSYFGETVWPAVKYGAKMSWESVAAYKRMHTGESAKGLLEDARRRGHDTGTLAQAKRFVSGPVSLGVKAGKHTAHWLKKNWAPMAEEMKDLPAMGLALLTGYEAVEIAAEAADLDLGGVIGGAIGFMAAKYAYMGWHNRSVVKDIVSKTTQQEKILAGAVGTVAAMSTTQMALEALHSTFAYGRYGLKPKELYPLLGGEYAASAARMEENTYDFFFKLADNLESEDLLKKMTAAAARFQMGIEEAKDFHVNMTKDVFTSHLKTELESWRFLSDLPRLEKKPQDAAKVIPKEDRAWYAWHTDNTGFLFPWLKEKIPAHQDQLWGMYNKAKGRAVERVKELQGNRAAVLEYRKRFDRLKTRLGVKLEERRRTGGSKISGHDDDYSHEAFSKKGTTSESRDGVTDFGSGYRGLEDKPKKLSAQTGKVKRVIGNTATLSSSSQMKRRRVAMHGAQRNGNAIVRMSQHGNFGKNFNRSYRG